MEEENNQFEQDKFVSVLKEELQVMNERRTTDEERIDPVYKTLKGFLKNIEENGQSFSEAYSSLSDPQKYAIITRLENREMAERNTPDDSKKVSDYVVQFIKNQRQQLGIEVPRERNGETRYVTDINKITELRKALNHI